MMKTLNLSSVIIGVTFSLASTACSAQSTGSEQFDWMLGNWKGKMGKGEFYESWTKQDDCTLIGEGYLIMEGDTALSELLRIQKIGNYWTYIPIINNSQPVLFTLIDSGNNQWIFENKEHDFPQSVVYNQEKDGSMFAWIEGEMNGKQMKEEYRMKRIK